MKNSLNYKLLSFLLSMAITFLIVILILPFAAQSIQDFSPDLYISIYMYHSLAYAIVSSLVLAIPLWFVMNRSEMTSKMQFSLIGTMLVLTVFLATVYYFNVNYLNELWSRPTYE